MADIRISPLETHYVNIFGKIGLYTTAWADLCLKLNSDALFLLSQGSGSHSIDMIPHHGFTALEMVENLFGKFEQRVSTETFDWENYPLHCGINDSLGLTHENSPNGIAKTLGGCWHGAIPYAILSENFMRTLSKIIFSLQSSVA